MERLARWWRESFNGYLDRVSEYLARRKGLLPMVGLVLVVMNLVVQGIPGLEPLAQVNLFLHCGVFLAILGFLLAWAL